MRWQPDNGYARDPGDYQLQSYPGRLVHAWRFYQDYQMAPDEYTEHMVLLEASRFVDCVSERL